jgi:tRNA threonylcarbamoyladenosine biosynthesis protein TsaE
MKDKTIFLVDEESLLRLGAACAVACAKQRTLVFLTGPLGAGKTTFARGFLQGLGHEGTVKSPTYTLIEPYEFPTISVFHFDFYRLKDPEELEFIGLYDYLSQNAICLIEWPEQGGALLPVPDLDCTIALQAEGREIFIQARTDRGQHVLEKL